MLAHGGDVTQPIGELEPLDKDQVLDPAPVAELVVHRLDRRQVIRDGEVTVDPGEEDAPEIDGAAGRGFEPGRCVEGECEGGAAAGSGRVCSGWEEEVGCCGERAWW